MNPSYTVDTEMLYRSYVFFLCLSIISCAISVSLSQLFLALAFVTFMFLKEKPLFRTDLVLILSLFYSWQFVSLLYHYFASGLDPQCLALAFKGEMKDILIFSAFFVIQGVKKEDHQKLEKAILFFAYIILMTGLISVFSPIRLSRIISDLYRPSTSWPFQHHYGQFLGINFYLPIGLMNTHLTFGGLISFVFPYFVFQVFEALKKKGHAYLRIRNISLLLILSLVFLLNNARSAMLGVLFSLIFGIYLLIFIEREFTKKILRYVSIFLLTSILLIALVYSQSSAFQKVIRPLLGSEKHTDPGRSFIWDSTFPLIFQNPNFGIGPGAYPREIEISRKEKSLKHKELSFFYENTQRGHSHNDFFHLATIFGLSQAVLYFVLGVFILYGFSSGRIPKEKMYLTIGLSGFFISGLLQCYFQDDEVLIFFFYLLGYYHLHSKQENKSYEEITPGR